jgi:hypothetical protein
MRVLPSRLVLENARDARKVIVSGRNAEGFWVDLSAKAQFGACAVVKRDSEGFFHAAKAGAGTINVSPPPASPPRCRLR